MFFKDDFKLLNLSALSGKVLVYLDWINLYWRLNLTFSLEDSYSFLKYITEENEKLHLACIFCILLQQTWRREEK